MSLRDFCSRRFRPTGASTPPGGDALRRRSSTAGRSRSGACGGAGLVTVKYLGTEENTADIFTKILDRQPFEKHRKTVLNAAANDGVPSARSAET